MERDTEQLIIRQNLSLFERLLRLVIGLFLMSLLFVNYPFIELSAMWNSILVIAGIYPLMTGMVGEDPVYSIGHIRSCGTSDHNQCGTLPYQLVAATDNIPGVIDDDSEHSLGACHPANVKVPHHKVWRAD